jgi:hypothetical protein
LNESTPLNIRGGDFLIAGITTDRTGILRTMSIPTGMSNSGAAGLSIGAYEKD